MSHIHTVRLEVVRPGPAHNQLLSPLTRYVALCGPRGANTFSVPFEHRDLLARLGMMCDTAHVGADQRRMWLRLTGESVRDILGSIPALTAAMSSGGRDRELIHLRLCLSPAELAIVPYELAVSPPGLPGEGLPLLTQQELPVVLTREARLEPRAPREGHREPRILVAAAAPDGTRPVPLDAHLLAIRHAVAPWIPSGKSFGDVVTVLPRATFSELMAASARGDYTHVHVLAHGTVIPGTDPPEQGVALHQTTSEDGHAVGGEALADALCPHREDRRGQARPDVVVLAVCDSGRQSTVLAPSASIAHSLHLTGIPWVMASQFPLSYKASVLLADGLYGPLLRGDDPRLVLYLVRQRLRDVLYDTHDWASLVAYANVEDQAEEAIRSYRRNQAASAIRTVIKRTEVELAGRAACIPDSERVRRALEVPLADLERSEPSGESPSEAHLRAENIGLRASAAKIEAEILWQVTRPRPHDERSQQEAEEAEAERLGQLRRCRELLERSRRLYEQALQHRMDSHWLATQFLCLSAVLGHDTSSLHSWSIVARLSAERDLAKGRQDQVWAHGSLMELALLGLATGLPDENGDGADAARTHVQSLVALAGRHSNEVDSTRRQLLRYTGWWLTEEFGSQMRTPEREELVASLIGILDG